MDKESPTKEETIIGKELQPNSNSEKLKLQRQLGMEGVTSRLVRKVAQGPEQESQCCPYPAGQPGARKDKKQSGDCQRKHPMGPMNRESVKPFKASHFVILLLFYFCQPLFPRGVCCIWLDNWMKSQEIVSFPSLGLKKNCSSQGQPAEIQSHYWATSHRGQPLRRPQALLVIFRPSVISSPPGSQLR